MSVYILGHPGHVSVKNLLKGLKKPFVSIVNDYPWIEVVAYSTNLQPQMVVLRSLPKRLNPHSYLTSGDLDRAHKGFAWNRWW